MKILVLPGDGIGPEITDATLAVLDRANAKFKLKDPATRTADLGGKLGTRAFARHVASLIGQEIAVPRSGVP